MTNFEPGRVRIHKRKYLPHWNAEHGTQFVTFRTATIIFDVTIAAFVAETITHDDEKSYELLAWCVMPDHVHVVLRTTNTIASVVQAWKSVSARKINETLNKTGRVWQEEYYDHLIRDERELQETIQYILDNPIKAELFEWPHVRSYPERF